MRLGTVLILTTILSTSITSSFVIENQSQNMLISQMLSKISEEEIYNNTYTLQNFASRKYGYTGNVNAAAWIYDKLGSMTRLKVEYQGTYNNVIATLNGTDRNSSAVFIVGAHYDSTSYDPNNAPGCTDNGGGCAIVLELARVMSQYWFNHTIKFAFWNYEEGGCLGSANYVAYAKNKNLNISLYINYDSAVLNTATVLDVMYDDQSMADMLTQQNNLYSIGLQLNYNGHYGHGVTCTSDYVPFKNAGKAWVMTHQQVAPGTPTPNSAADHAYQHTPDDTVDKISTAFAKKNGQLGMSVLAILAEVQKNRSTADVNNDGAVDICDVAGVSAHWYPGPPIGPLSYDPNFDIDGDGAIDVTDTAIISAYWTGPPKGPLAP